MNTTKRLSVPKCGIYTDRILGRARQAYVEFTSQQAATAVRHHIESLNNEANQATRRMTVVYSSPVNNPFRTLPKDAAARPPKDGAMQNRIPSGQGYQDRQSNNMGGGNYNQGGGYRGRGGYGGPRGNMNPGAFNNRSYNQNMGNFGNNMGGGGGFGMGGGVGGYGGPGNFGGGGGGFRGGNMMGGGMRGGMRGGRGGMGNMGMMGGMPMGGAMPMGPMGGGMGGMGMMGPGGMPGACSPFFSSFTIRLDHKTTNNPHRLSRHAAGIQPSLLRRWR